MEVAKELNGTRFTVGPSAMYIDPETQKLREMDVIGSISFRAKTENLPMNSDYTLEMHVPIECKLNDEPWMLLAIEPDEHPIDWINFNVAPVCSYLGQRYFSFLRSKGVLQQSKLMQRYSQLCYGVATCFSKSDIAYKAVKGVTSCSISRATHVKNRHGNDQDEIWASGSLSVPVVVTTSKLFRSYLGSENEVVIDDIECGMLKLEAEQNPHSKDLQNAVLICTKESFADIVLELLELADILDQNFQEFAHDQAEGAYTSYIDFMDERDSEF